MGGPGRMLLKKLMPSTELRMYTAETAGSLSDGPNGSLHAGPERIVGHASIRWHRWGK